MRIGVVKDCEKNKLAGMVPDIRSVFKMRQAGYIKMFTVCLNAEDEPRGTQVSWDNLFFLRFQYFLSIDVDAIRLFPDSYSG